MTSLETYTFTDKLAFWLVWALACLLGVCYIALLGVIGLFVAEDGGFESEIVPFIFLSLILTVLHWLALWLVLQRFLQRSHELSSLILTLTGVIVVIPLLFFAGCVGLLSLFAG